MRKRSEQIAMYAWHSGQVIDGVFSLVPDVDHKTCVFCHQPAPCSLYYPPIEREAEAPIDIPRARVRVCQNHYGAAWKLAKAHVFPLSIEELYDKISKSRAMVVRDIVTLPQWTLDFTGSSFVWRGAVVPKRYYEMFQRWFNIEGLMYKDADTRLRKSGELRSIFVDTPEEHLLTFERYIMEPEEAAVRNAAIPKVTW